MNRISTLQLEGTFQASKWLKIQALVEPEELMVLLEQDFVIYPFSAHPLDSIPIKKEKFLGVYQSWIDGLKRGIAPEEKELYAWSASAWITSFSAIWLQKIPNEKYLAKPCEPFLQCQVHHMNYSPIDGVFRSMTFGSNSIFWGLQFSFPQIYQHPKTGEFLEVNDFALFHSVRKWSREFTVATPMVVDGRRKNIPIRLGKQCFSWINTHPQLQMKGLSVLGLKN